MTAQILSFPQPDIVAPTNEPAAVSRDASFEQPFHYWRGQSGRRYLHTVFSLIECPELPKATYILVHRDADGTRRALAVGQTVADAASLNLAHLRHRGAQLGANEIHIHLLAESAAERQRIEADLEAARLTWGGDTSDPLLAAG